MDAHLAAADADCKPAVMQQSAATHKAAPTHIHGMQARSLVELLQQTQVVRQLSHIMQRALVDEGKTAGTPWDALKPQVHAIG